MLALASMDVLGWSSRVVGFAGCLRGVLTAASVRAASGWSTGADLGLSAEIGGFDRFSYPRELASWLGITPRSTSPGTNSTAQRWW